MFILSSLFQYNASQEPVISCQTYYNDELVKVILSIHSRNVYKVFLQQIHIIQINQIN
jgi:hypothetical protein